RLGDTVLYLGSQFQRGPSVLGARLLAGSTLDDFVQGLGAVVDRGLRVAHFPAAGHKIVVEPFRFLSARLVRILEIVWGGQPRRFTRSEGGQGDYPREQRSQEHMSLHDIGPSLRRRTPRIGCRPERNGFKPQGADMPTRSTASGRSARTILVVPVS